MVERRRRFADWRQCLHDVPVIPKLILVTIAVLIGVYSTSALAGPPDSQVSPNKTAASAATSPVSARVKDSDFIGFIGSGIIELGDSWGHNPASKYTGGVRWGHSFSPWLALTLEVHTNIAVNHLNCGVNWYWFDRPFSPYVYAGVGFMAIGIYTFDSTLNSGLGFEYTSSSGFTAGIDFGIFLDVEPIHTEQGGAEIHWLGEVQFMVGTRY